jgi:L,D-transpeptidase catalytic domain
MGGLDSETTRLAMALPAGQNALHCCRSGRVSVEWVMMRRCLVAIAAMFAMLLGVGAATARVDIRVDLASQRMTVTTSGGESYNWAVSSGRQGYRTPNGVYRPQRLEKKWYSRKYGGNMPNAVFFRGGYAIHATGETGRLGRPASHGCVRLHPANAARLFALVQQYGKGATRIAINGIAPDGSQFARSRQEERKPVAVAKAKRKNTDWATARGRVLEHDGFFAPGAAMGFQPVSRSQGNWFLRR